MKKNIISILLISIFSFSGALAIALIPIQPAVSHHDTRITIYSWNYNRHGRIVRTSVGTFYIGKSGDAILKSGGHKHYGYWESRGGTIYVYIGTTTYYFNL